MEICLLVFISCVLPASPLISTHSSFTALQVSVVLCCLPSFPSLPGSGSDLACFLATGDEILQLLQPIPSSAGQLPPPWVRCSPGAAVPLRSPRGGFVAELSGESISIAAFGLGAGFMIAS